MRTGKADRRAKESEAVHARAMADVAILRKRIAEQRTGKPRRPQDDQRVQREFRFDGEVRE